jgi:hypothetical protein
MLIALPNNDPNIGTPATGFLYTLPSESVYSFLPTTASINGTGFCYFEIPID